MYLNALIRLLIPVIVCRMMIYDSCQTRKGQFVYIFSENEEKKKKDYQIGPITQFFLLGCDRAYNKIIGLSSEILFSLQAEKTKDFAENILPTRGQNLEKFLCNNKDGKGFFVGDSVSVFIIVIGTFFLVTLQLTLNKYSKYSPKGKHN